MEGTESMMTRRMVVRSRWLLTFCLVSTPCAFWLLPRGNHSALKAAPHTISRADHPYDPDWPDVHLILTSKCTSCHRPDTGRCDFSTYEAVLAAGVEEDMPAVVPGKPEESALWQATCWNAEAHLGSDLPDQPEMPPDQLEWLTAGQMETIRRWISNGALQYRLPSTCNIRPLLEIDFPSAKQCAGCHPRQYDDWSRSMHAYAQHSPTFQAFNLTMIERTGGTIGTFCTRCHTPIGTTLGENGSRRNIHRSRVSMEGVTCVACHRRKDGRYKSNGRLRLEPGDVLEQCVFGPFDDAQPVPASHDSKALPYIKTSQFCGECHDVTSPSGVRLEEAFSEWQNSPAAKAGITCQHCHMGPVQGVPIRDCERPLGRAAVVPGIDPESLPLRHLTDHTFAGPDYSLLPDTEFPHKLDWMYEKDYRDTANLTPHQQSTLNQLRRLNRASLAKAAEKRYEVLKNAAAIEVAHPDVATTGGHLKLRVRVKSKFGGHSFPTGFTAERQVWLSVVVRDPLGREVFVTGDLDKNQDLRDDHSHGVLAGKSPVDRHLVNLQSKFVALTNKGTERSVVLSVNRHLQPVSVLRPANGISASFGRPGSFRVSKGSLPPFGLRNASYPIRLNDCPGVYTIEVRLNFRHLPPTLLDHIGVPNLKHLLEIVVLDEYRGLIHVTSRKRTSARR